MRSAQSARSHLEAALDLLKLNEELDRLMDPRHTE
jgi:hypothetical protein